MKAPVAANVDANRRLEWVLRSSVIFLGLLQAWATRDAIDNDVLSYLDMGDALLRGDWTTGVNGTWTPLYGVLLSAALRVTGVSPRHEYATIHGVVFLIFVATVFAFGFFLRELASKPATVAFGTESAAVSTRTWILLGYVLFSWSTLDVIGVSTTNPDMVVAACVYAATGLLIRVCRDPARRGSFICLGLILGLAYLTKPFMFFGALPFLAVAALATSRRAPLMQTVGVPGAMFLLLAVPYIAALSYERGHLSVSESGRMNYAIHVNQIAPRHWQGSPPSAGMPVHPTRQILESPPTWEFDRPIPVTYPLWYDPSYWYEGVRLTFRPSTQLAAIFSNAVLIVQTAYGPNGAFIVGLLILSMLRPRWTPVAAWLRANWYVVAPSVAAPVLYALVHAEARYLGAFLVVVLLGTFMALATGGRDETDRLVRAFALASGVLLVLPGGLAASPRYYRYFLHPSTKPIDPKQRQPGPSTAAPWRVAAALRAQGLKPGDRIGAVQYANWRDAAWARLARVKIVSEVRAQTQADDQDFWRASPGAQEKVVAAMIGAGVRAIVSDSRPSGTANVTWRPLGETDYYVHLVELDPPVRPESREKAQGNASPHL